MKDYESYAPLEVVSAEGPYLQLADGRRVIDSLSSWWCKSLGHKHPRLRAAMIEQSERLEHVMLANTTNETIVACSEAILALSPVHDKVFYASDGSCAVEIALKLAIHAQHLRGETQRTKFLALTHGYHGETGLALSVSDEGIYKDAYRCILQSVPYIDPTVLTTGPHDPNWHQPIDEASWQKILLQLAPHAEQTAALILEPIVQGAGNMRFYHPDVLRRLRAYTQEHSILLIADEIMTGIGRTGKMLACEHAGIHADLVCLSKGLNGGYMPFSAVMIPQWIYDLFYDDYQVGKSFLHSQTFTGHTLAARITTEALAIMQEESICQQSIQNGELMRELMQDIAAESGLITNVRQIGSIAAAELAGKADFKRAGFQLAKIAAQNGALMRPLGNTLYWMPPLNCDHSTLQELANITAKSLHQLAL
jgi:adenosylmethionine-8-amino-7-oxononanoate aminotransferase